MTQSTSTFRVRATGSRGGAFIENEAAYEAATQARIRENARKGRGRRWLAEDASREALVDVLRGQLTVNRPNNFLLKMWDSLQEWGSLTPGQEAAVRKAVASDAERKAQWAAKREAERAVTAAVSKHVGKVGERRSFTLTCDFETSFETQFGFMTVLRFRDADGNVLVYKGGSAPCRKGERVTMVATVKEHGERDGVAQTILARPGKVEFLTGAEA